MPLNTLRANLRLKSTVAIIAVIVVAELALLLVSGGGDGRADALEQLRRMAALELDAKSRAIQTENAESVRTRLILWRRGSLGVATEFILVDGQGETIVATDKSPNLEDPDVQKWLARALGGKDAAGEAAGWLWAIEPLGPAGTALPDETPVGAFIAAAPVEQVSRTASGGPGAGFAAVLVALAGVIILGMNYWFFLRPIQALSSASAQTDVDAGRVVPALDVHFGDDDLGRVGRSWNLIAERLMETQALHRQANSLAERAEAKYRNLAENTPDVIWRIDMTGQFLYVSPAMEFELGLAPQAVYESPDSFYTRAHPDDQESVRMAFAALARGERIDPIEFRLRNLEGAWQWMQLLHFPILDARGRLQGVEGLMRNVTERKRLQSDLEDSRFRFEALWALSNACRQNLPRRELFDLFAAQAVETLGMERGMVARIVGETYRVAGMFNFPEEVSRTGHSLAESPQGRIARTGRPLALLDEESWKPYDLQTPFLGAPILDRQGETIGVICCYGATRNFEEDNIRAVSLFAEILAPHLSGFAPALDTAAAKDKGVKERTTGFPSPAEPPMES